MPILPLEPDIFPADLLDAADDSLSSEPWWALYTLSRREKDLMRRLQALQVPHFGPLVKHRQRSPAGRVRTSYMPLFPGYVFLRGDDAQRQLALTTGCVSRCLEVPDARTLVADLARIRRLIQADAPLTLESQLGPGMRVRIRSGSLAGLEGIVIQRRGQERLLVSVAFLQQGASILLEDIQVERIE
jgi:transcription antitermination factor NusG